MFLERASGTILEPFSSLAPSVWIHLIALPSELK